MHQRPPRPSLTVTLCPYSTPFRPRVHHRRQHAHVIGAGPVESLGGGGKAAKDVSATHHDAKLLTALARLRNLLRKPGDRIRIDSELARTHQPLTRPEERRVGKECVRPWRPRGSPYTKQKNQ